MRRRIALGSLCAILSLTGVRVAGAQGDPLPSWNDGPTKQSIVRFVQAR